MTPSQSTRTVLITGGSRGIGLALVKKFKAEGWWVATCATHESHLLNNPADFTFVCDVSKPLQVKKGIEETLQKRGQLDALMNNAGLTGDNPMAPDSSDELWHRIIDVNLHGTYYFCKYAGTHLRNDTGRIVNIASNLALRGVPDAIAYCAAKHGVLGLTRSLAHYFAPRRITVNALCPGWVRTDMAASRFVELKITEKDAQASIPLGRLIEPEEVADFAYFLVDSKGGAMTTGQALTLDGGLLA